MLILSDNLRSNSLWGDLVHLPRGLVDARAQHLALPWTDLESTRRVLESCHAFVDPTEAGDRGIRLRLPDQARANRNGRFAASFCGDGRIPYHIAAPEDDQAGFQLLFIRDKRHGTLHCAESVQVRGEDAQKSITVQVLCSGLCLILLIFSSCLLESRHP